MGNKTNSETLANLNRTKRSKTKVVCSFMDKFD